MLNFIKNLITKALSFLQRFKKQSFMKDKFPEGFDIPLFYAEGKARKRQSFYDVMGISKARLDELTKEMRKFVIDFEEGDHSGTNVAEVIRALGKICRTNNEFAMAMYSFGAYAEEGERHNKRKGGGMAGGLLAALLGAGLGNAVGIHVGKIPDDFLDPDSSSSNKKEKGDEELSEDEKINKIIEEYQKSKKKSGEEGTNNQ